MSEVANKALHRFRDNILARMGFQCEGRLKKIDKYARAGLPVLVAEPNLKTQQNIWVRRSDATANMLARVAHEHRSVGVKKSGELAEPGRLGRHSGPSGYLQSGELVCFHPATEEQIAIVVEGLVR